MELEAWYEGCETVTHAGLSICARDEGEGPALLCVHGFPTSSWDFAPIWAPLVARFRVIASDLIGLGRSAKPRRALPIALQADALESVLAARGVSEAHLLAHDLGDTVVQELLARQAAGASPVRWRSVVFLNGGLFPETHRRRPIQALLASPLGPLIARLSSERTFRKNMRRVFGPRTPPSEAFLLGSYSLLQEDGGRAMLPRLIRYMDERVQHRERWVRPLIDRIVPARFINGALDPVSGRHAAARYRELVPEPDVVLLEHVGHYPHVEDPEAVLAAFFAFHDALGA